MEGIDFSFSDYNVNKIKTETGFDWQTKTNLKYYVYGLKQENDAPIKIEYNKDLLKGNKDTFGKLDSFFKKRGIVIEWDDMYKKGIDIGLRKDLRQQPKLSAAIVSTIVYALEGKIKLKNSKVLGIPKFNGEI